MPNHVTNTLVIYADDEEVLDTILEEIKGENEFIDFATIIPEPDNLFKDDLSGEDRKRCEAEGVPNWYDWNCKNWGTKWNAYAQSSEGPCYGEVTIIFDTAWAPPLPIIDALRKKYKNASFYGS